MALRAAAVALSGGWAQSAMRTAFAVQYPAMAYELGGSVGGITGAFAVSMPLYAISLFLAGASVDRVGVRVTMVAGLALMAVGALLTSTATGLMQLYVGWAIALGPGSAAVGFVPILKAVMTIAPGVAGQTLAVYQLAQGAAIWIVTPALAALAATGGWRFAQVTLAAVLLASIPLVVAAATEEGPPRTATRPPLTTPALAFAALLASAVGLGLWFVVPVHQVAQLAERGFGLTIGATLAGGFGLASVAAGLALVVLADRMPVRVIAVIGGTLLAFGTGALAAAEPAVFALVLVYITAGGAGRAALGLALSVAEGRILQRERLGRDASILEIGVATGALIGPWLAAVLRDRTGSYAPGLGIALFGVALCVLGLVVALTVGVPTPRRARIAGHKVTS